MYLVGVISGAIEHFDNLSSAVSGWAGELVGAVVGAVTGAVGARSSTPQAEADAEYLKYFPN
jgi:outer membrane lipoprotein SlyB